MTTATLFPKTHHAAAFAALFLTPGVMSAQALVKTIPLGPQPPFVGPHHELLVPAANRLYAINGTPLSNLESGTPSPTPSLAIVDTAAKTFRGTLPLPVPAGMGYVNSGNEPNRSTGFFVSGTKAYIAFSGPPNLPGIPPGATTGLIVVVDATTDTVAQTLPIPGLIANMVFNPNTQKFYVLEQTSASAAQILVYDATTLTQVAVIPNVNTSPNTLDVNPAINRIYASLAAPAAGVIVIDGSGDFVTAVVNLPDVIGTLIADPVNNKVFAGSGQFVWTTAYDIDGVTAQLNKVITTITNTFFVENFTYVNSTTNQVIVGNSFQIDGVTDTLTRVPFYGNFALPLNPHCSPMGTGDGAFDFTLNNWYSGCDGSVLIADPSTGNVKSTIPLSFVTEPTAFTVNPQTHIEYELSQMGNSVAIIDPIARTTSLVQLGNLPAGIAANPTTNRVYVADASASAAVIIDGATNTVLAKNFVEPNATSAVVGIEVNPTTNQYVFADDAGMAILNGATDATQLLVNVDASGGSGNVSNKQTGLGIRALNPVTNALYTAEFIAAAPSPTVYVTSLGFGGFVAFTDASCPVFGLAVNPANDWIYVGSQCQGGPLLEVFDAGTKVLLQSLDLSTAWPAGSQIGKMVFNSQTGKLYILNNGGINKNGVTVSASTEVYNAATLAHLSSIAGVTGPLAVNRVLNAVYGAFVGGGGGVATIDGNTDLLSATFGAGLTVSALAVNEATNMVYVGDATQGAVLVFQGVAPSKGAFTIGGRVVNGSGAGLAGVTVVSQGAVHGSTVTDSNGLFTLIGFPAGTYTIQPTSAGLLYGPASQTVTISTASVSNLAFTGLSTPIAVNGIVTDLAMIGPGVNANATVTLNQPAPPGGIVLTLTSSNKAATVAKSVTVPAGSSSATFTVQGTGVSSVTAVTLTATYSGPFAAAAVSGTGSISVSPTDNLKLTSATFSKSTQVLTVNATSTNPQAILSVILASNNSVLGVMSNLGGGNYSFQTVYTSGTPTSVNVKSNLGGQTGQGVKSVP